MATFPAGSITRASKEAEGVSLLFEKYSRIAKK
jgi:hypothetical protein